METGTPVYLPDTDMLVVKYEGPVLDMALESYKRFPTQIPSVELNQYKAPEPEQLHNLCKVLELAPEN